MSAAFFRTMHELETESPRTSILVLALATALISAWVGWLFLGRVRIYRSTDWARLEIASRVYPVQAAIAGRIVAMHLILGQQVHAGEMLVELDSEMERRALTEDRTRLAVLAPELIQIDAAISSEVQSLESSGKTVVVELEEAQVRWRSAQKLWGTADEIAKRYLAAGDVVPKIDVLRAQADAESHRAAADTLHLDAERLERDRQTREADRSAHIEQLRQDKMRLEGEQQTTQADIKRLEYEIEKRSIRAAVDGQVVGLADFRPGSFVHEDDRLCTIVPPEKIRAVADFLPSEAVGHIRPGQQSWLHLRGFPSTQYGTILATVASVASEPHEGLSVEDEPPEGLIRVELVLKQGSAPLIPIQHGLPGRAEIEVERISPAKLIMRTVGELLTEPTVSREPTALQGRIVSQTGH